MDRSLFLLLSKTHPPLFFFPMCQTRERWQSQITKLECSAFWVQCAHHQTREGLRNMLKIMMGNVDCLSAATSNWMELFVSHLLYLRPFTKVNCFTYCLSLDLSHVVFHSIHIIPCGIAGTRRHA